MSIAQPSAPVLLEECVEAVFGDHSDPMPLLEARARTFLPGQDAIVWECDARTFVFSYVSESAERVMGYPARRWTDEPTFWADVVLHSEDREPSVNYCVAETRQCRDHAFEYRAVAADGRVVRLRDIVAVLPDANGAPERLRGIMIPVSEY